MKVQLYASVTLALAALVLPRAARADDAGKCKMGLAAKFPVIMEGSRASVPARFNGKEMRVWLVSGVYANFMSKAKAAELGLATEPVGADTFTRGTGSSFHPNVARVREFTVAGTTFHDTPFIIDGHDVGNAMLGANFLGTIDTEFDLAKGVVNLFKESGCRMNMAYWASGMSIGEARLLSGTTEADHAIYVEVIVNGISLRAMLDTGAPDSVIERHAAERAGIKLTAQDTVASRTISGMGEHPQQSWIARGQTISIGGEEIRNSPIRVIDYTADNLGIDMLLGVDFLMAHHVLVSQPQRKMFLTYNGGPIFSATTERQIGHLNTRAENMGAGETAPDPKSADEFAGRASGRLARGDASAAIADFTAAIRLAPERADLLAGRADVYLRKGQGDLAAQDLDAALAIAPQDHRALFWRAIVKLGKADRAGALADTAAAAAATPKGSLDMLGIVTLYERLGLADLGLALLDPVIALHRDGSNYPSLLNARSWNRGLANTDLDRALADANAAIRQSSGNPAMLDTRALVQFRRKAYAEAIADETLALAKAPGSAAAFYVRGLARLASGDAAAGQADLAVARAIRPQIGEIYATYGLAPPTERPEQIKADGSQAKGD